MMRQVSNKTSAENESSPKVRRKLLLSDQKLDIISKLKNGLTRGHISQQTGIPYHTIAQVQRRAKAILASGLVMSKDIRQKKYRERNKLLTKIESLTFMWIQDMRSKGFPLSGDMIKSKAKSLYAGISEKDERQQANMTRSFCASSGWFPGFKKR